MKMKSPVPAPATGTLVRRFGQAQLLRHPNGRHALVGGTPSDHAAALEWVSLFAHKIVFRRYCDPAAPSLNRRPPTAHPVLASIRRSWLGIKSRLTCSPHPVV